MNINKAPANNHIKSYNRKLMLKVMCRSVLLLELENMIPIKIVLLPSSCCRRALEVMIREYDQMNCGYKILIEFI